MLFNLDSVHPSWLPFIKNGLSKMDEDYLSKLSHSNDWLPGPNKIFRAFSIPLNQVNIVLFGESPYPRAESANGYAFWDQAVTNLWSPTGLSKTVNRATSLRNIIKMLLIANGTLRKNHTSQLDIAKLDKQHFVTTNQELFENFINHGILLLNACLVLTKGPVNKDARAWKPFIKEVITGLLENNHHVEFILFGNIAKQIDPLFKDFDVKKLYAQHPYNISFINNDQVIDFFAPLNLLKKRL